MAKDKQSRKYQLTINNPADNGFTHDKIKELLVIRFKSFEYGAMSDEIGERRTTHTHVFICFRSPVRFSTIKKHFPTAHIEAVVGSIEQNTDYLKKAGKWAETDKAETSIPGTFEEFGEKPPENLGKDKNLENLYHMIVDEGLSNAEIIRLNQDYIMQIDKLDKIRTTYLQDKFKGERRLDLEVTYVFGATGTGKSRGILDEFEDSNVYRVTDYNHPFDHYSCEPVLVFEEFRSSLTLSEMLNYLDIYPATLPARYSNKYACFNRVFIVTNWDLEKQYAERQVTDKESWHAFLRRIHKVKHYVSKDEVITYDSVDDFLNYSNDFMPITRALTPFER
ncbi:hypothetical protein DS742_11875 [Lacrimispora amygdalina]|uniref:CRESS-DNA virus Rep endonuclease domain-containing protein n=1 Tax=Lacrimispora amygdalina TaxID=253257 RepID=A0A3E2ND37_9FIRM|nr:hypothetical protein [Clostridium indicum]RFZ78800.1 hypothetical protein DS742_11875 [Clostridium indicum]